MNLSTEQIHIGDCVTVSDGWGRGPIISGTVTGLGYEADRPVIDYRSDDGKSKWAYLGQIVAINSHD